jgi:hypothetical protein
MSEQVQILHHVPGRIRIKVPRLKGKPKACKAIDDMAIAIQGVHGVKAHPVTGSVLVHYDKANPEVMRRLEQALEELENFLAFIDPNVQEDGGIGGFSVPNAEQDAREELLLRKFAEVIDKSDQQIRQASHGAVDLATALPLLLAGALVVLDGKAYPMLLAGLMTMSFQSHGRLHQTEQGN